MMERMRNIILVDFKLYKFAARCVVSILMASGLGVAAGTANAGHFDDQVRPLLVKYCQECHSGEKPKGDFRVDRLSADFADQANRERWQAVQDQLKSGAMPPQGKPRPPQNDLESLSDWIGSEVTAAAASLRTAQGRVVLRRLNRVEYENTVRDLLGVDVELKELLPLDSSASGFDNIADALHTSSFLMERYLEAADTALNVAIANLPQPATIKKRYSLKETHHLKVASENVFRKLEDDGVVLFTSVPWQAVTLSPFYPSDRGRYRFRISASGIQSSGKPITYRLDAGPMLMGTKNRLVGYFDAPAEKSAVVEFLENLEARSTLRIHPYGLANSQVVHKVGADAYDGPGLAVEWVEVEGPLHDTWPPESHRRIFGDLLQAPAPTYNRSDRVEVVSKEPAADAERILRKFMRRAFRRTVSDGDVKPYIAIVEAKLAEKRSFEQAVRVGLGAVLASPEFLFLHEQPGTLDAFALASRLSYFLWNTMPDEELLALAEKGPKPAAANDGTPGVREKLSDTGVLHRQVERMLESPKAASFIENFVGQWLGLRDIDFTEPSHILHPEFDDMLKVSMVRETELFFAELLKHDLSLMNFVSSDFTMLNGRLAKHYGIPGVEGWEFHKMPLPPNSHRGGVITMASVLKVTANGTNTSPVTRGAWVLDRILGTPPPKPPENVAALEPDIRGATTIREQLAKHRQIPSCASCHAKIDPPGFALESFDVIGGWREKYRLTSWRKGAEEVTVDGRKMPYLHGLKVDPADVLPDGRTFQNIDELKQLLLTDKDQIARALTIKLLTYATGGVPEASDLSEIDAIVGKIRDKNFGLRSLVHEIVQSKLFREK
jgi:hypothetical protein